VKEDDRAAVWYRDFLEFAHKERLFATMCTRPATAPPTAAGHLAHLRFTEILGFYGLPYLVHLAGERPRPGAIWIAQRGGEAAGGRMLEEGGIFAYGLVGEGARSRDLYSTEMALTPADDAPGGPTGASTTSATATRPRWSPPSEDHRHR